MYRNYPIALMVIITGLPSASCRTPRSPIPISTTTEQKSPSRSYAESDTTERIAIIRKLGKAADKGDRTAIKELVNLVPQSDGGPSEGIYGILSSVAINYPQDLIYALDELPAESRSQVLKTLFNVMPSKSRDIFESTLEKNSETPTSKTWREISLSNRS